MDSLISKFVNYLQLKLIPFYKFSVMVFLNSIAGLHDVVVERGNGYIKFKQNMYDKYNLYGILIQGMMN